MTEINFLDFDLLIAKAPAGYRARVLNSPVGQAVGEFSLPFSELEDLLSGIHDPQGAARGSESPELTAIRAFGGRLFEAVFGDELEVCLRRSQDEAAQQGAGLRLRLRLAEVPELAGLPWEYLYHPQLKRFFSLSTETPIVRYLDLPERIRPLTVKPPLRILSMVSSPRDLPPLDVEAEWNNLQQALDDLERRGLVKLERLEKASLTALLRPLRRKKYHVFHFVGHGDFDERAQDGVLLLEDEDGLAYPVTSQHLGALLRDERTLRLVLLNACEGARASLGDPFAGTAQGLVQQGIPAVIAMQSEITDLAAGTLAYEFYAALADGYPVDAALAEARKAIFAQGNPVEWGTPVLYMRAPNGRIFDVAPAPPEPDPAPIRPAPPAAPAAHALRARPAKGGDSIGNYRGGAATLGCLVADRDDPGRRYLLCDFNGICYPGVPARAGDPILQPGPADGGQLATDVIAILSRWTTVSADPRAAADNVSAAIARVSDPADVSPEIRGRGPLQGVRPAVEGTSVWAAGRTGGVVSGTVLQVGVYQEVPCPAHHLAGGLSTGDGSEFVPVMFGDLIACTPLLKRGDSGAVLVDAENYALGLGFAGSDRVSLFIPMHKVLDALNVDLIPGPENQFERADARPGAPFQNDLIRLHELLSTRFDQQELRTLCFYLSVDFENLGGEGKEAKARELLTYLAHRNRIPDLIRAGRQLRPDISWE